MYSVKWGLTQYNYYYTKKDNFSIQLIWNICKIADFWPKTRQMDRADLLSLEKKEGGRQGRKGKLGRGRRLGKGGRGGV